MPNKIYEVPITRHSTEYAYIYANDAQHAQEIIDALMVHGELDIILGDDGFDESTQEAITAQGTEEEETNALANLRAYREYIAADGASI